MGKISLGRKKGGEDRGPLMVRQEVEISEQENTYKIVTLVCETLENSDRKKKSRTKGTLGEFNDTHSRQVGKNNGLS